VPVMTVAYSFLTDSG